MWHKNVGQFLSFCHNPRVWQTDGQKGLGNRRGSRYRRTRRPPPFRAWLCAFIV